MRPDLGCPSASLGGRVRNIRHLPERSRKVRHLPDVSAAPAADDVPVLIRLEVDAIDPPVGSVIRDGALQRRFVGWVELLSALSEVLEDGPPADEL